MAIHYQIQEGDRLDLIAYQYYGASKNYTEKLLETNVWLRDYTNKELPTGKYIILPDIESNKTTPTRLW